MNFQVWLGKVLTGQSPALSFPDRKFWLPLCAPANQRCMGRVWTVAALLQRTEQDLTSLQGLEKSHDRPCCALSFRITNSANATAI